MIAVGEENLENSRLTAREIRILTEDASLINGGGGGIGSPGLLHVRDSGGTFMCALGREGDIEDPA